MGAARSEPGRRWQRRRDRAPAVLRARGLRRERSCGTPQGATEGARCKPPRRRVTTEDAQRAIETVWRMESAKLIAGLTRMVGDVGLAEDLAQDALVAALEKWPESGVPDNPATSPARRRVRQIGRAHV